MLSTITSLSDLHKNGPFFLIAGPCAVESEAITLEIAHHLKSLSETYQIQLIFKASFRKANRTSGTSFSGIEEEEAIRILRKVKTELNIPILTDIHETTDIKKIADIVDVIQIPAFLCRQTDLIVAAAKTGLIINIKKGQFASADTMRHAVEKVRSTGNERVMVTERGTFFGYQDLVVDYRNIIDMAGFTTVVFDGTHSFQKPNQSAGFSGGDNKYAPKMAKAALITGAKGIFLETHPNPFQALSDKDSMIPLSEVESFIQFLVAKD